MLLGVLRELICVWRGAVARWLQRPFEEEEIKLPVFTSDRDKSPGLDGFLAGFFQDC